MPAQSYRPRRRTSTAPAPQSTAAPVRPVPAHQAGRGSLPPGPGQTRVRQPPTGPGQRDRVKLCVPAQWHAAPGGDLRPTHGPLPIGVLDNRMEHPRVGLKASRNDRGRDVRIGQAPASRRPRLRLRSSSTWERSRPDDRTGISPSSSRYPTSPGLAQANAIPRANGLARISTKHPSMSRLRCRIAPSL